LKSGAQVKTFFITNQKFNKLFQRGDTGPLGPSPKSAPGKEAQLASARPVMPDVPKSIPGDFTSLFQLLFSVA